MIFKNYSKSCADADHRKNVFLAMLAHELRNPLAPMRHALEALRRLGGETEQAATLREVIAAAAVAYDTAPFR